MSECLKELRKKHNLTQRNMSDALGLKTVSAYSKKENGKSPLSLKEAKIISEYINEPIDSFCP
ncbi:MAG: helix-turn-helix transcriptional regulator [Velocimicrobium sp.]